MSRAPEMTDQSGRRNPDDSCFFSQGDADPAVKLEFDDDGMAAEGGTGENAAPKPKAPRVKKEPGQYSVSSVPSNVFSPVQETDGAGFTR